MHGASEMSKATPDFQASGEHLLFQVGTFPSHEQAMFSISPVMWTTFALRTIPTLVLMAT